MIYFKWFCIVIVLLIAQLVGTFIGVPLAILFSKGKEHLPRWAWIFSNDREPLGPSWDYETIKTTTGFAHALHRWKWLAWRNPVNNLCKWFGIVMDGLTYEHTGDPFTTDALPVRPGTLKVKAFKNGKLVAFCYYRVSPYTSGPLVGHANRTMLGWKIHGMQNDGRLAQCVFSPNPVKPIGHR